MDRDRFDQLARRISSRTTRRSALAALAAVGVGGLTQRASLAKKQCGKTKPCPACQHCNKKHKCKPVKDGTTCTQGGTCQSGACVCPTGTYACASANTCCANGTTCTEATTCGVCPAGDVCSGAVVCGQFGPDPTQDLCACVTSVQNTTTCSSGFGECFACTTDAECTTELGGPAACVDFSNCPAACDGSGGQPDTHGRVCLFVGCEDFSGGVTTTRRGDQRSVMRVRGFGRTP